MPSQLNANPKKRNFPPPTLKLRRAGAPKFRFLGGKRKTHFLKYTKEQILV